VSASGLTILAEVAEDASTMSPAAIESRISELEQRVAKTEAGTELDKLITRLDNYKTVHRHLIGTAMH
jgi:F0F1-type ATP synthase epsilon subunit